MRGLNDAILVGTAFCGVRSFVDKQAVVSIFVRGMEAIHLISHGIRILHKAVLW